MISDADWIHGQEMAMAEWAEEDRTVAAGEPDTVICAICGLPVDRDEAHWLHEDGCPGVEALEEAGLEPCDCDLYAHPECDPWWAEEEAGDE